MRLILMRHAKSDWSLDGEDHARPLNSRGRASAKIIGNWLRERGYIPDLVLCSTSVRTRETLVMSGIDTASKFEDRLYHAAPDTMLASLRQADGDCVLMITHNPGAASCAARLVKTPPSHPRFRDYPTCATLVVDFDGTDWAKLDFGNGNARDFVVPRDLLAS
jgi:phosphohistidine phosphatase